MSDDTKQRVAVATAFLACGALLMFGSWWWFGLLLTAMGALGLLGVFSAALALTLAAWLIMSIVTGVPALLFSGPPLFFLMLALASAASFLLVFAPLHWNRG
jgi:hypothetical protein